MSVFLAMLLGLLQGAAVFLPISSTGHQVILHNLLKLDAPTSGLYTFMMNLSTLISILLVYKKDIGKLLREGMDFLKGEATEDPLGDGRMAPSIRLIYFIVVGTVPMILTTLVSKQIDVLMGSTVFVSFAMIATGAILFAADKSIKPGQKSEKTMTTKDALFIGLGQAFAVLPGLSRLGNTFVIGLVQGLKRDFAIRFSIFLSLPAILFNILFSFLALFRKGIDWSTFLSVLVAFVISSASGYFCIQVMRLWTKRKKLLNISIYLWVIGVVTLVLSFVL